MASGRKTGYNDTGRINPPLLRVLPYSGHKKGQFQQRCWETGGRKAVVEDKDMAAHCQILSGYGLVLSGGQMPIAAAGADDDCLTFHFFLSPPVFLKARLCNLQIPSV